LGTRLRNRNLIQEETKRRLNSGNACYYSLQNLLASRTLPNEKIKIYKHIILPVVLYRCATWSEILKEEHRLWVFDDKLLRRIFGHKGGEVIGGSRKLHNEELHNLYPPPNIIKIIKPMRVSM
jgi:hypothetical protein